MITFNRKADSKFSKQFELRLNLNNWELVREINEIQLRKMRDDINEVLGLNDIASSFGISITESEEILKFHKNNLRCSTCAFKLKECFNCVITCQSPLERDLFLALLSIGLDTKLQQRINKDGQIYGNTEPINKAQILTLPDFYIATAEQKYCIYTDGHTYHERTEYQALRDRSIDRELQLLGFVVLRYTGKEIRTELKKTALQIFQNVTKTTLSTEHEGKLDAYITSLKKPKPAWSPGT